MSPPGRKLRIGILQESACASVYVRELVTWAGQQDDLEITHLIIYGPVGETRVQQWRRKLRRNGVAGALRIVAFRCIRWLEQALLRALHGRSYSDHTRRFPIDQLIPHKLYIHPTISGSGLVYRFSAEEIAKVRSTGCDLLVRGGNAILGGDILEATRLGILSLQHGDNRINRGGPPGFWESYLKWPATGFVIQRLTSEFGGEVFLRGAYATEWFFLFNQANLFSNSNLLLQDVLKRVAREGALPPAEEAYPSFAHLYRLPSLPVCAGYLGRVLGRLLRRVLFNVLHYRDRWAVSYIWTDWRHAALWHATTPRPPAGRFLADPFVWEHQGKTFCLVEDYSYRQRIGRISAFLIDEHGTTDPRVVLAEPFHLSFPYLFDFDGTLYLCPESCAARQIRLYRAIEFPHKWEFAKVIMTDVSAGDTMIFQRDGLWWMLTNLDRTGRSEFRSELYLFSASSPLTDSWIPHPGNPIKIDPAGGRNAGLLRDGDRLYRAGQIQGFDRYGMGIRLFEICSLSTEEYRERPVADLQPAFRSRLLGTHHVSSTGRVTVVDSHRREFVW